MKIFIILLLVLNTAMASDDAEVRDLFNRYERVVSGHETHLVEEVFSEKFLKENGGKAEFIEKVKSEPKLSEKAMPVTSVTWKKAAQSENLLVKLKSKVQALNKLKTKEPESHSEFIVVKENGKLKIDGTISDAD